VIVYMPEVKLGCIWMDALRILFNVNHWVKGIGNIHRPCKTTLFSYITQV